MIEHQFAAHPPKNAYGAAPFLTAGDYSKPNEAYFAHAEYVISKAAEKGILVMLTPSYMGFNGLSEGWYQEMKANGATKLGAYGQYLANRFRAHDNILWVQGGDYNPPELERGLLRAIANGIRAVDTRWLHTFHGNRGTAAMQLLGTAEPWLTVNTIYTNVSTVVASAFQEYNRSSAPFFLIEALYEGEGGTPANVRQQAYQTVLSGGAGQLMGNNPIWRFNLGWQSALNSGGAQSMTFMRTLLEARSWWNLQPDLTNVVLTGGFGTGAGRAPAAKASDGSFALIYAPDVRTLTVNMSQFAGPQVNARWYDPTAGTYTAIAGAPFAASGAMTFRPTANNSTGSGDWVLVLESIP